MKSTKKGEIVVTTTMSKAYQITVPSVVRKAMGLVPGDEVDFKMEGDGVRLVKALTREERIERAFKRLDEWRDDLPDEVKEKIEKYAGWTANQYREYIDNLPEVKTHMEKRYGV